VAPATGAEFNVVTAGLIPVACWRVDDIRFEFASSFVTPGIKAELSNLAGLRRDHPGSPASVFGHADPVSSDDFNKVLSGRRAIAIFGLLTRDTALWDDLFRQPVADDRWGTPAIETMQAEVKAPGRAADIERDAGRRRALYGAYMEALCGPELKLVKRDFIARGADGGGKGDFQGCSEFNPLLIFSRRDQDRFADPANKDERNRKNAPNRRVTVLLFRPGTKVDPARWPCPRAREGIAGCVKRFWSDGQQRRTRRLADQDRLFEETHDTFACRFYHRLTTNSPCEKAPPPLPPVLIELVKVETSEPTPPPVRFVDDDDFSPRLGEHAKFHVRVHNLPAGAPAKVRLDVGRLTNRPDDAATADVNESFTLVARLERDVVGGDNPLPVEMEWDGNSTVAVAQEFSNRTTPNTNTAANVNIPMQSIANGQPIIHGLYVVDQVTLLRAGVEAHKQRPVGVDLTVPMLVNVIFNANWPGDLRAFGLAPFQAQVEDAIRRFGGRDYMIRDPNRLNRVNARYITNPGITNAQSVRVSVGGLGGGVFGSTPDGPAPLDDNLYTFHEGISADVTVFPSRFMTFNTAAGAIGPLDQVTFRGIFGQTGVAAAASGAAPGVATPRAVAGGVVTGACDGVDAANVTVVLDADGIATVTSTNPGLVPAARAGDIQRALRAFVRMVGNTINHEVAHALGLVSRLKANNSITIGAVTVTSPLNGDGGAHNRVTNNTNIVDAGGTRNFVRRIENTGIQQVFNAVNVRFLRDCIPFDRRDD